MFNNAVRVFPISGGTGPHDGNRPGDNPRQLERTPGRVPLPPVGLDPPRGGKGGPVRLQLRERRSWYFRWFTGDLAFI